MVDNVTADPGSGGSVFATDEVSSVHYPINKLAFGALDTVNLVESTTTNPFPVALSDTDNAVLDAMEATLNAIQTAVEGTQTVSGTVTANLSATDNAVLDAMEVTLNAIQTAVELLDNTVSGTELQVDIVSDGAGLLTTAAHDAAFGTAGAADAQVRTVQGIASMTPLLVDATGQGDVPVTLAGEAVSISGSVTVTGDVTNAGTFAVQEDGAALTALQLIDNIVLTEDSSHNTGDSGVQALAVRNDTLTALAGTDGDYAPLQVDQDGALYISEANRVDSNNSSTSTLGIGGVFTGTSTDVLGFRNVSVAVYTDQNSATDGLQIQFSSDGTNWDHEEDYTITGGTAEHHTVPVMGRYFRVVYTNGGTGQTAFRLESVLFADDITGSVSPIDSAVGVGNQAVLTKSVIAAENPSNTYVNIGATNGGNLKVSIEENSADVTIADGGNSITVDATSLPLPTGASTAANQSTANTALSAIQTAVELIDNAISGSEMQVDVVAALPAGANTIGDVTVSGDALTALQLIDDAIFTDDTSTHTAATTKVAGIGAVATPTDATVDANDIAMPGMSTDRRMWTDAQIVGQDADLTIADGGNSITVDGTVTANLSATDNAVLDTIETNTDFGAVTGGGVEATALRVTIANDSTGVVSIDDNAGSITVDNSGTFATQATLQTGSNLACDVGIQGRTTGGLSTFYDNDLDQAAVAVKGSAGTIYAIQVINTTAAPLYLQLFDVAQGSVTVGTTTPTMQYIVPANADSDGAGFTFSIPQGVAFSTAITAACSTDNEGNSAPGANACNIVIHYK